MPRVTVPAVATVTRITVTASIAPAITAAITLPVAPAAGPVDIRIGVAPGIDCTLPGIGRLLAFGRIVGWCGCGNRCDRLSAAVVRTTPARSRCVLPVGAPHTRTLAARCRGASGCGELAKILPAVTDELWEMGYSDEDIRKIYGGNQLRVFGQVWK